ncbi:hypothetical protein [Streptomyces sp. NP160]|nr:hypothetical protein [Streptomyces sp. NP160]
MTDKSSHSSSSKGSGRSIKQKRADKADKKAASERTASGDQVSAATKR